MNYTQLSCEDFIARLSSQEPTPGGGGAAALMGAVGAALAAMVGSLTTGKKKYAAVEEEIQQLLAEGQRLQAELLAQVEADAQVFAPLAAAYALPKETLEQQQYKAQRLSEYCIAAARVPLNIMEKSRDALLLARRIAEIGSKLAVSDAGCAAYCLNAAIGAARLNVLINLPLILDKDLSQQFSQQADQILAQAQALSDETIALVLERL